MSVDLLEVFPNYVQLFQQLQAEYDRTPGWRMIRQFRLNNQMHRVNKRYEKWFDEHMRQAN